jgi:4-alpha-glucanotransferase
MAEAGRGRRRVAGMTIPLFSVRTATDWGIGEFSDLPALGALCAEAGLGLVQLLPLGEIGGGETSPYAALSAFGLDPLYIGWSAVEDLGAEGAAEALGAEGEAQLARVRAAKAVDYDTVRALKARALDVAWRHFRDRELSRGSDRARAFEGFCRREAAWLDGFVMFRALKDAHGQRPWWEWPAPLRDRDPAALDAARAAHADALGRQCYAQWIAHTQWDAARADLKARGVEVMGDLPFMVGRDSADVWAERGEFRDDASVGVPADQFDPDGQEWGLPPYRWQAMRGNGFRWLRRRARYAGERYDRFRIDHLVGFFRTYMRDVGRIRGANGKLLPGYFDPADEAAQRVHGEAVIGAMKDAAGEVGADLVAEDLGVIPDFVRPALVGLDVPGYKVLVWERDGLVYRDPAAYPARSVACFGTHDTDPVAAWWEALPEVDRAAVQRLPRLAGPSLGGRFGRAFTPEVHTALLGLLAHARSELVLLLAQDVLGSRDRINVPGTVGPHNWTWRLPDALGALRANPAVAAQLALVRTIVAESGRALPPAGV